MLKEELDKEPTSYFIKEEECIHDAHFSEFSVIASSGYSQLTRAKRHGRWWMLNVERRDRYLFHSRNSMFNLLM